MKINPWCFVFQLSFDVGDVITVLEMVNRDWWWAELDGCHGFIPSNYVISQSDPAAHEILYQDEEYFGDYAKLVRGVFIRSRHGSF